jgi:hypothetical protein
MMLMLKVVAVALVHMALFACYPETGPYGNYYLTVSLLVWSVFIIFVNTSSKLVRFLNGPAGFAINLAAFALMTVSVAATMPQRDGTPVLKKVQARRYPDKDTVHAGLLRFGITLDNNVKTRLRGIDSEVNHALNKLKEDQ